MIEMDVNVRRSHQCLANKSHTDYYTYYIILCIECTQEDIKNRIPNIKQW